MRNNNEAEYLPFFQDEFVLRAAEPETWGEIISISREFNNDNQTISRFIDLLANDEQVLPIVARRFAARLGELESDRGIAALATLEACIARHPDLDDLPSLEALKEMDAMRIEFIRTGKWLDTSLSFEHCLELQARERAAIIAQHHKQVQIDQYLVFPTMVGVPFVWFVILICLTRGCDFLIVLICFLFIEAATTLALVEWRFKLTTTRMVAVLTMLLLGAFSLLADVNRAALSPKQTTALALMQLCVAILNLSLYLDLCGIQEHSVKNQL